MQHHPVFSKFTPYRGEVPANFSIDFLGARTRPQFIAGLEKHTHPTPIQAEMSYPPLGEEYLEWIDLLESVVEARGSYTMIDLGAGFGRWSVRAAFALKQYNPQLSYSLTAVEAEPVVFQWMGLHFADNEVDKNRYRLLHAASSDQPGHVLFYIGGPRGGPWDKSPDDWYGQSMTKDYDVAGDYENDGEYHGFSVRLHKSGWRSIQIPSVTLGSLMKDHERVDLVDMDIEGQELPVIRSTIQEMDAKVKRVHIGTHGKEIEAELRQILSAHGWRCLRDYSLFTTDETPWGTVAFENGVQSWVNPRLE